MKVWELMAKLAKVNAGDEVKVSMHGTLEAEVTSAEVQDDEFLITGGDAELIDEDGESLGWLSQLSSTED